MKQKVKTIRRQIIHKLGDLKIPNPSQEADIILCHFLKKTPVWLLVNSDYELEKNIINKINAAIDRRTLGQPIQYILGETKFCNLLLKINKNVLIPRQETEVLIDCAKNIINKNHPQIIIDVGTGSGAIAVALGKFICDKKLKSKILALEISKEALKISKYNIDKYQLQGIISLKKSDLMSAVNRPADFIVANLPYVPTKDCQKLADPKMAVDGGPDGTNLIIKMLKQIHDRELLKANGTIILEIGFNQSKILIKTTRSLWRNAKTKIIKDLAGYDRVLKISIN